MSYEEYFSKERYIENLSDMGLGSLEWGGNHCSFFIRTLEGPVEIYRNCWPMENAYFFDKTVIYFICDKPCIGFLSTQGSWIKFLHPTRNSLFIPSRTIKP